MLNAYFSTDVSMASSTKTLLKVFFPIFLIVRLSLWLLSLTCHHMNDVTGTSTSDTNSSWTTEHLSKSSNLFQGMSHRHCTCGKIFSMLELKSPRYSQCCSSNLEKKFVFKMKISRLRQTLVT